MRINEVITESEQLDEIDWKALPGKAANAAGQGIGLAGKAAGAIPGALVGAGKAFAQGYKSTRDTVSGTTPPSSTPARGSSGSSTAGTADAAGGTGGTARGAPEANDQQAKIGVGQINKIIPTLRLRDLQSVKKTLDAAITAKARTPAPTSGTPAPGGGAPAAGSRPRGQEVDLGGKKYRWAGAQWVDVATGRMADRATAAQLNNTPIA